MTLKNHFTLFATMSLLFGASEMAAGAIYSCRSNSPKSSLFLDRQVKLDCDLDSDGNPKFVVTAGSSKVALNKKAQYIGPENGNLYSHHQMTALDGQVFDLHTATAMFTETLQASFFSVEPGENSGFWICSLVA